MQWTVQPCSTPEPAYLDLNKSMWLDKVLQPLIKLAFNESMWLVKLTN